MEKGTDPLPTWQLMTKCNRSRSGNCSERADGQKHPKPDSAATGCLLVGKLREEESPTLLQGPETQQVPTQLPASWAWPSQPHGAAPAGLSSVRGGGWKQESGAGAGASDCMGLTSGSIPFWLLTLGSLFNLPEPQLPLLLNGNLMIIRVS